MVKRSFGCMHRPFHPFIEKHSSFTFWPNARISIRLIASRANLGELRRNHKGESMDMDIDTEGKRRILVVDDSALVAEAVKAKLEASNYDVSLAYSGEEALGRVKEERPDLMILDVYMPGIDGFEVCRIIREDPDTNTLPIVMLSSRGNIKEKLAGFRAGADDYLVKEFDLLDLPYRVKLVFRLRGMEEKSA